MRGNCDIIVPKSMLLLVCCLVLPKNSSRNTDFHNIVRAVRRTGDISDGKPFFMRCVIPKSFMFFRGRGV